MVFWRKKTNPEAAETEARDQALLHPKGEPELEPSSDIPEPPFTPQNFLPEEATLEEETPTPAHTHMEDALEAAQEEPVQSGGWLSRLTLGLSKSTAKITRGFTEIFTKQKLDTQMLEQLEDLLIEADLGPKTAASVIADFSKDRFGKEMELGDIKRALAESLARVLEPVAHPLPIHKPAGGPAVILVCGVNGAGKTTTIGKLAYQLKYKDSYKVMIAAGDTFRAAAIEQLEVWAKRAGAPLIKREIGADAAAVSYEAYRQAVEDGADVLLIDTAGRLQNKANLMEELAKIVRVLKKIDPALPHACLLVLDSTTGQNAFAQVEAFRSMVQVTGLILTKLDGSAEGGVLVGLADQFGLPVHAVGVGEGIEDLQPFHPQEYAQSLLGVE